MAESMNKSGFALDFHPSDEELARLEERCFQQPWCAAGYHDFRRNPHVEGWLLRGADGEAIGLVCFQLVGGEAELFRIAVVPERRGQGWGALLLEEFLARCEARGAAVFFLEVRASNLPAARLYESAGFRRMGARARYFQDPVEDALIYRMAGMAHAHDAARALPA